MYHPGQLELAVQPQGHGRIRRGRLCHHPGGPRDAGEGQVGRRADLGAAARGDGYLYESIPIFCRCDPGSVEGPAVWTVFIGDQPAGGADPGGCAGICEDGQDGNVTMNRGSEPCGYREPIDVILFWRVGGMSRANVFTCCTITVYG